MINQTNCKTLGIKVNIQNYPASTLFGSFLTDGKPGTYDIVEYATGVGYDPDNSIFFSCNAPDLGIYKSMAHNYLPSAVGFGETINIWEWWCDEDTC